jgi:hypothetical protein
MTFSCSSLFKCRPVTSWWPLMCTVRGSICVDRQMSMSILHKSACGVLALMSSRLRDSMLSAAWLSHPMMVWLGDGTMVLAKICSVTEIAKSPVSSLLYALRTSRGPGVRTEPCIHWVPHFDWWSKQQQRRL